MRELLAFAALVLVAALLAASGSCSRTDMAVSILQSQGFTEIQMHGYQWFACGDDPFSDGFTATAASGSKVSGVVCSGFLKSATVRFK